MYSCSGNKEYLDQFSIKDKKMFLMPCAVDNVFFRERRINQKKELMVIRKELGIHEEDFVIMFSARFVARKRPLDLIEAVSKIGHNDITLLFVGDGLEREAMKKSCIGHNIKVVFTGFKGQKELPKYYSIADMYAIVSDYDASPKSLNEALNFNLPILTTDRVGTAYDLVGNNENGFIVESRDIQAMSRKINFFNKNREVAKSMGRKSIAISDVWTIENDVLGIKAAISFALNK
jgi:glycosyltransferase involved in cell wall biosynthesis